MAFLDPLCSWAVGQACAQLNEGPATLLVALLGIPSFILGWIITARMHRANYRDQNSYNYLIDSPANTKILEAVQRLGPYLIKGKVPETIKDESDLRKSALQVGSYFEQAAVSVRRELVSEQFLYLSEHEMITLYFFGFRKLLQKRERSHRPIFASSRPWRYGFPY